MDRRHGKGGAQRRDQGQGTCKTEHTRVSSFWARRPARGGQRTGGGHRAGGYVDRVLRGPGLRYRTAQPTRSATKLPEAVRWASYRPLLMLLITPRLHHDVQHNAVLIDRPPEPVAFTVDLQQHLVEVPFVARSSSSPA